MRSMLLRSLLVPITLSLMSGCAFTQWTDHAYLGSPDDPPTHANHEWVGAVILPIAVVGDIVTAPGQLIALLAMGDDGIYAPLQPSRSNRSTSYRSETTSTSVSTPAPRKRWKTNKVRCTSSVERTGYRVASLDGAEGQEPLSR